MIAEAIVKKDKESKNKAVNKTYTFDEYFKLEEQANYKNEFQNGKIVPMSSGTINHALIISSLHFYIKAAAKQLEQQTLVCNSEMRVYIEAINESVYPDCCIIIGERETFKKTKAIKNPTIIFEVLSKSTGNYDRGAKFRKYKNLPSFQEYVLIEQDQPAIDVVHKNENGVWEINSFVGLNNTLALNTLDVKVALSDIYEDVENLNLPQSKMDLSD